MLESENPYPPNETEIFSLPSEVLINIFSFLTTDEKKTAAQVCSYWRTVCYSKSLWQEVTPAITPFDDPVCLKSLGERGISGLYIKETVGKDLSEVLSYFPDLLELTIEEPFLYEKSCKSLKNLRALHLHIRMGMPVKQLNLFCEESKGLIYLNLSHCSLNDQCVKIIAQKLPHLESLVLSSNKELSDTAVAYIAGVDCKPGTKNLEDLSLANCPKITPRSVQLISANLRNLKTLDLSSTFNSFWKLGFPHLQNMTSLEKLWVSTCSDESIPYLVTLTSLRSFYIDGVLNITEQGAALLMSMKSLKTLTVGVAAKISDDCMAKLASIPSMNKLSMSFCDSLSRAGYASLAACKNNLTHLDISMSFLDEEIVKEIGKIKKLTNLGLGFCYTITDNDINYLSKSLPLLESLDLNSCSELTDRSLEFLAENLSRLRFLDIGGCPGITKQAMEQLARKFPFAEIVRQFDFEDSLKGEDWSDTEYS